MIQVIHLLIAFCLGLATYSVLNHFNVPTTLIYICAFTIGASYGRWIRR